MAQPAAQLTAPRNNAFVVGVKLLSDRFFHVVVGPLDTVSALKQRIFEREGIPPPRQNLLVLGTLLQPDTRLLSEFNLKAGNCVYVTAGKRESEAPNAIPIGATGTDAITRRDPVSNYQQSNTETQSTDTKMSKELKELLVLGGDSQSKAPNNITNGTMTMIPMDNTTSKESGSGSGSGVVPGTDVTRLRASTIQYFATVTTVLRPHMDTATPETNSARWPKASQAYCIYTRKSPMGDLTGVITFGLSNPYKTSFFFAIGVGVEILLEVPSDQARLTAKDGTVTGASISDSWMFSIVHEIGHQVFALGLQIRQLLEKLTLLSVEIAGVNLPSEYVDPQTGRACVLLGHLGDPDVPRGFNVTVPHQQNWIVQSVLFVPARLLTFAECQFIRKDGAEARKKLAESYIKQKEYSVCNVPTHLWPIAETKTANTTTTTTTANTTNTTTANTTNTTTNTTTPAVAQTAQPSL